MTQGLCERDDLPEAFVKWADSQGYGEVLAVTWFDDHGLNSSEFVDHGLDMAIHYADAVVRMKGRTPAGGE